MLQALLPNFHSVILNGVFNTELTFVLQKLFSIFTASTFFFCVLNVNAQESVALQLKWFHSFQFAGYYAAKHKGYYSEAGFDVTILGRNETLSPVDAVLSNTAQFGISDSSIVQQKLSNKPVVIATSIFQSSPLVFMSLREKGITSPYDLRGKRIMFQKSVDDASLEALLLFAGLKNIDYQYVTHTFDDNALIDDVVDVMSAYRSDQPIYYANQGVEVNLIDPGSYGIDFYGDLLFTSQEYVENNIERVDAFVEATHRGWLYALENKQEIVSLILKHYAVDASAEHLLEEAKVTESLIQPKFVPIGTLFPQRFERIAQTYRNLGMASPNAKIDGLFLNDYKESTYAINARYAYVIALLSGVILLYSIGQYWFNKRLRKRVNEKTEELNNANALLQKQNTQLEVARKEAEKANRSKSSFLSNMSHEIRTPLNGVFGTLQLIEQRVKTETDKALVKRAKASSSNLLTIINDILDFSKIEAGKMSFETVPFSVSEMVTSVEQDLSDQIKSKGIDFTVSYASGSLDTWLGDPVRVKQVLLNLCSNAVKFTDSGDVRVDIDCQEHVCFSVSDTGVGMNDQELSRLYSRFEQANETTTRKYGGTGLGMAITKTLVDAMQGDITVYSKTGEGTKFTVSLPLIHHQDNVIDETDSQSAIPNFSKKHMLIAEDNEINRFVMQSMLEQTGATLTFANDGREAVSLVEKRQHNDPFDLILMDIQMPKLDGISACKEILILIPEQKIIAVTANVYQDDIEHYNKVGFTSHIGKPVELECLFKMCAKVLN